MTSWRAAFVVEAGTGFPDDDHDAAVRRSLAHGNRLLLCEAGGEPVAHAAAARPVAGMSRIGPVYTPPEHRGRGYGSAVTAAATAVALDDGARTVVLFTDLANPVSNAIYPRVGYRAVADQLEIRFAPRG